MEDLKNQPHVLKFKKDLEESNLELSPDTFFSLMKDWTEEGGNDPMDITILTDLACFIILDPANEQKYRDIHKDFNRDYLQNLVQ